MAKKRKRKTAGPAKSARRKVQRRVPSAAAHRRKTGAGLRAERLIARWSARLRLNEYNGRDWGRLALLSAGLGVIFYYAFSAGGYFVVRRSYGELVILWLIVVGLLFELQTRGRMPRLGQLELGIFSGYTLWILLSVSWSIMPANSFDEFVRGILYISGFLLFFLYLGRREWLGWLGHLFVAIAVIVAIDALLGKTFPEFIDHPDPFMSNRINYPITYWNTMAIFMNMAFIIGLRVLADRTTHVALRAAYAPALLLFTIVLFFTFSRAGLLLLALAFGVYLFLALTRLRALMQAGLLLAWTAGIVLISYLFLPNMVASVPDEALKVSEGRMLALAILAFMLAAAASQFPIRRFEDSFAVSADLAKRIGYGIAGGAALLLVLAVLGFTFTGDRGGPVAFTRSQVTGLGETEQAVDRPSDRLLSLKSERVQEYGVSLKSFREAPLTGTGAGTWNTAWLKHRPWNIQVKDGHSWLFETMAELGLVGTLLLVAFMSMFFAVSIRDLRFLGRGRDRELYGAFFAVSAMFLLHSLIDWDWEMPVITLAFFMFAGGLLRFGMLARAEAENGEAAGTGAMPERAGIRRLLGWNRLLAAGCVAAIVVTIVPLVAHTRIQAAQKLGQSQNYAAMEKQAASAGRWAPLSAEPLVLQALAKQALNQPEEAEALLLEASRKEPENAMILLNLTGLYLRLHALAEEREDIQAQQHYIARISEVLPRARALNPLEPEQTGALEIEARKIGVPGL
ncbi:MAG: O-antigen ligase family protein [Thermoleophilia bacterium]|nr:O-antigen ligase family protein [Thermoleophilia bacterium]